MRCRHSDGQRGGRTTVPFQHRINATVLPHHGRGDPLARKIVFFAHTSTNFTIQPGAGVDVDMTENTAFRIEADYRHVFYGAPDQNDPGASLVSKDGADYTDFSFSLGVVWRVGQR